MAQVDWVEGYGTRTEKMTAWLTPSDLGNGTKTNDAMRRYARSMGHSTDHAGHILAANLGGSGTTQQNIFPQDPNMNTGYWAREEALIAKCLTVWRDKGDRPSVPLKYVVTLLYAGPKVTRPYRIVYDTEFKPGNPAVYPQETLAMVNCHGEIDNP